MSTDDHRLRWLTTASLPHRYINHAPAHSTRCNLAPRVDFGRQLVWFEASRDIAVGEELSFDYGPDYNAPWAGSASASLVTVA